MNLMEALEELMLGHTIRCEHWEENEYISFDNVTRQVVDENGQEVAAYCFLMLKDDIWKEVIK